MGQVDIKPGSTCCVVVGRHSTVSGKILLPQFPGLCISCFLPLLLSTFSPPQKQRVTQHRRSSCSSSWWECSVGFLLSQILLLLGAFPSPPGESEGPGFSCRDLILCLSTLTPCCLSLSHSLTQHPWPQLANTDSTPHLSLPLTSPWHGPRSSCPTQNPEAHRF